MNDKQKAIFTQFWLENSGLDKQKEIDFILSPRPQQKAVVQAWWNKRKAKLEADKATLTQEFIASEVSKIDAQIADGEDLITVL